MTDELKHLQSKYDRLAQRIKPCIAEYSFLTERRDDGSPHVEYANDEYHYLVTERGLELERRCTPDINEILYWMIYDLTFWMGVAFELKNRIEGPDVRRVIFARQLELIERADHAMADRLERQIAETLSKNPFIDHKLSS
jgi:hypothetical protein